jgi:hypothetical protein
MITIFEGYFVYSNAWKKKVVYAFLFKVSFNIRYDDIDFIYFFKLIIE